MWELWRELGGLIPETLEVHVPSFGLKVRIPVPESMPVERPSPGTTPASQLSSEKAGPACRHSIKIAPPHFLSPEQLALPAGTHEIMPRPTFAATALAEAKVFSVRIR